MKHILNNMSEEEKNSIREQHTGGMKVTTENFSRLLNSKLGDSKPLVNEQTAGVNFQQGVQTGVQSGQNARKAVNTAVNTAVQGVKQTGTAALQGAKQVVITIGKVIFYAIITGGVVVFLIGKQIYKVSEAVGNSIIKFLAATGKATVSAATQVSQQVIGGLQSAGIAINKGAQFVGQQLGQLKDSTVTLVTWMINQFKQFGTTAWAKILVAASQIKEWSSSIAGFLKQSWNSIQNEVGVAWEQASNWASSKASQIKQGVQSGVNKVKQGVQSGVNKVANTAGNVYGAVQGFFNEMFERYFGFEGTNILEIISEASTYNGKSIL